MGVWLPASRARPDFVVFQVEHSHLDVGHGTIDDLLDSSIGLVPAPLWDGLDIIEQLCKGVAALFDGQDALWGQGEVAEFGGGGQHRDEGLRVLGPAVGFLLSEELSDSGHTVFSGEAESTTVFKCIFIDLRIPSTRPASRQHILGVGELLGEELNLVFQVHPDLRAESAWLIRPAAHEGWEGHGRGHLLLELNLSFRGVVLVVALCCWGGEH